jgi:hypothetical protein
MTSLWVVGTASAVLIGWLVWEGLRRGLSCGTCLLNILIGLILIAAGFGLLVLGGYVNIG